MTGLCLSQTLRHSGHSAVAARSVSRGISAAAFTRDLHRLSRLLWHFQHVMSSKTAHSLLAKGVRSALREGQFSSLMKARRFLQSHTWVEMAFWAGTESCWKTHSWPLKMVMLRYFTTPCSTSSWYTQTPVWPLSCKNEDVSSPDGTPPTKPWCRKSDGLPAPSEHFPSLHGTFEHISCFSGGYTAPWWWRFSRLWRGCFRAPSQCATGGDALLLYVRFHSKQE